MRTQVLAIAAAVCAAGAVRGQTPQEGVVIRHQEMYAIQQGGPLSGPGPHAVAAGMIGADGKMGLLNVTGKPLSATEVRRTVQMLANGAKIENSDSNQLYRDDQGRTRAEQTVNGKTVIVIMDPVGHFVAVLDRAAKTARKTPIPAGADSGGVSVTGGNVMVRIGAGAATQQVMETHTVQGGLMNSARVDVRMSNERMPARMRRSIEELGTQSVNGVPAQGTRVTQVIPAGEIGNDRELQVVDERWFSSDLQMLVKSVNSDPRFGETTYQLTNILRVPQDPGLFQVPADYVTTTDDFRMKLQELKLPGK